MCFRLATTVNLLEKNWPSLSRCEKGAEEFLAPAGMARGLGGGGELDCGGGDGVCDGESGFVRMCCDVFGCVRW